MEIENNASKEPGYAWFDGMLDGRIEDASELRKAVRRWEELGLPKPMFSIEGGRFSFLPGDDSIDADAMGEAVQADILALLEQMVSQGAAPGSVESTLRCTLVRGQVTNEFLFGCVRGELQSVSRSRALNHEDRDHAPRDEFLPDSVRELGRKRALMIMGLALVGFVLAALQSGWVDRAFSADSAAIVSEEGAFDGMLEMEIERKWGNYVVTLVRGDDYPLTPNETQALREFAVDNARDVAITAVSSGQQVYIQLLSEDGDILEVTGVGLRSLITEEDAEIEAKLSGRISARTIRLSLSTGKK